MCNEHAPEVQVISFAGLTDARADARAERERQGRESRRRYVEHLAPVLARLGVGTPVEAACDDVLDALTVWTRLDGDDQCLCSCHPRLPQSDFHDYGFDCACQHTAEQRRQGWDEFIARQDEFSASPEGRAIAGERQAEEDELHRWLDAHPEVVVTTHGGMAPEQWSGSVDGHSFYFRERHDEWRIEVDLRPSGRFYRAWTGDGALDDDSNYELRQTEEGDVIADGTTRTEGYGTTPRERIEFIVGMIRGDFRRRECRVHVDEGDALEARFGAPVSYCPACGVPLAR